MRALFGALAAQGVDVGPLARLADCPLDAVCAEALESALNLVAPMLSTIRRLRLAALAESGAAERLSPAELQQQLQLGAELEPKPQARVLDVSGSERSPPLSAAAVAAAVARFPALLELALPSTGLDDAGAAALAAADLRGLVRLDLRRNRVTADGARALAGRLPRLAHLALSDNRVGDAGAAALAAGLPALRHLYLSRSGVHERGARELAGLTALEHLRLSGNRVGRAAGALGAALGASLRHVRLARAHVTDEGARALAQLQRLEALDLSDNRIADGGAQALVRLPALRVAKLAGNSWIHDADALADLQRRRPFLQLRADVRLQPAIDAARLEADAWWARRRAQRWGVLLARQRVAGGCREGAGLRRSLGEFLAGASQGVVREVLSYL